MLNRKRLLLILCMVTVILISNILVQYPVMLWGLEDLLTWAAFTYPVAFFITDITNRIYGESAARRIVYWGFITAVVLSFYFATPRIAIASGSAFLLSVGIYPLIIGSIANFNLNILFPFAMGMLIALVVMPRLINMVYEKFGRVILVFFGGLIFVAGINSFL